VTSREHVYQAEAYLDAADHALNRDTGMDATKPRAERVADAQMYGTLAIGHALLADAKDD
jgi:hypothetical protein